MIISLCQTNILWEDKSGNLKKAESYIASAASQNTDLILFPEMSFTGFSMNIAVTGETDLFTVQYMKKLSMLYRIHIGFGWVKLVSETEPLKAENHYTVIDKYGAVLADYVKIHPFSYAGEDKYFRSGSHTVSFSLDGIPFSIFICYDLRFPEIFRKASEETAFFIVPANWPKSRREHWKCLLKARAIENQAYVLGINCTGSIGDNEYTGNSSIIDPAGTVLKTLSDKEGSVTAEMKNDLIKFRSAFPVRQDRRHELYASLYNEEIRG